METQLTIGDVKRERMSETERFRRFTALEKALLVKRYPPKHTCGRWFNVAPYTQEIPFDGVPGVYVIYVIGKIVYVGQSDNLKRRLRQHGFGLPLMTTENDFFKRFNLSLGVGIKVRPEIYKSERYDLEKNLINKLKPIVRSGRENQLLVMR